MMVKEARVGFEYGGKSSGVCNAFDAIVEFCEQSSTFCSYFYSHAVETIEKKVVVIVGIGDGLVVEWPMPDRRDPLGGMWMPHG